MSHEEVEKRGDFSVKEFSIFLYNQTNNHEIGVVKTYKKGCSSASLSLTHLILEVFPEYVLLPYQSPTVPQRKYGKTHKQQVASLDQFSFWQTDYDLKILSASLFEPF